MDSDESGRYRRLAPSDKSDFLMNLAVNHLSRNTAREIIERIDCTTRTQTGIHTLPPRPQNYTRETTVAYSRNLAAIFSRFNIATGHGQEREWEVGHNSPYDELDNRQSGTKISI